MATVAQASSDSHLAKSGIVRIVTVISSHLVTAAIFFSAAGSMRVQVGWIYYGGLLAYLVISIVALFYLCPTVVATVNARGKRHRDVKTWDKVFGVTYAALLLISPAVAGFDCGRIHTLELPRSTTWLALAFTCLSSALAQWAMVVNKHAETGVRLQSDRDHEVISSGPYAFVRHPFYVSMIATQLAYPVAVGSLYASIPAVLIAGLAIWRTAREDETLRRELPGYAAFAEHTRYRLLPKIW